MTISQNRAPEWIYLTMRDMEGWLAFYTLSSAGYHFKQTLEYTVRKHGPTLFDQLANVNPTDHVLVIGHSFAPHYIWVGRNHLVTQRRRQNKLIAKWEDVYQRVMPTHPVQIKELYRVLTSDPSDPNNQDDQDDQCVYNSHYDSHYDSDRDSKLVKPLTKLYTCFHHFDSQTSWPNTLLLPGWNEQGQPGHYVLPQSKSIMIPYRKYTELLAYLWVFFKNIYDKLYLNQVQQQYMNKLLPRWKKYLQKSPWKDLIWFEVIQPPQHNNTHT